MAYSSPVVLISRRVTSNKGVVTDFRHLNVRIAKNNLAFGLLKDTFQVLGSSKCEVLSVLDLKDAFHSLRLSKNSKRYCGILPYFGSTSYLHQRMPMGLNILNIAKNNLAFGLLKDTFQVLGSSRCEVLSVLDLKDAFHSLRLSKNSKRYCGILPYFGSTSYLHQRMPMGLNILPSI